MKILHINSVLNSGSTGRIVEEIGTVLLDKGHQSFVAFGRKSQASSSSVIKIGSYFDKYRHGLYTYLTDKHGFSSEAATYDLIKKINLIKPDLIALYNLHGYYINIKILFDYLSKYQIPIVWTLFDCWGFTGHCTYFDDINCVKWKIQCQSCPKHNKYPSSLVDNSFYNFREKKNIFTSSLNMELVVHSKWLGSLVRDSFLQDYPINITPSGINLSLFKPLASQLSEKNNLLNKKVILGVANIWTQRKGLNDFIELSYYLDSTYQIVLIGLNHKEKAMLPSNIIGIKRTESIKELAEWYSLAFAFINLTTQDNFPTTNLEALACGTPVITYNTGGSPEAIDSHTGFIVEKGDVKDIFQKLQELSNLNYDEISIACRRRAEQLFDRNHTNLNYIKIFEKMLSK
jgi:glycosyltransferase involved in cell wall biosynthesis